MRTIAIVNQKGGSGKTTTAVNLGAALAQQERRVLIADLDAQASATTWYGIADGGRGLLGVFTDNGNLADVIINTDVADVSIVPSSMWLVGVERALAGEVGADLLLRRKLQSLPQSRWDYALLDCPPALGLLTVSALAAAGEVIIPVEAHVMALGGLAQLLQTVEIVRERMNEGLKIGGIVVCRVDTRTRHAREVVEELRERFGGLVYRTVIRENVRLAEAPSFGQPIIEYDHRCAGAEDYRALAAEVIAQEQSDGRE